VFGLVGADEVKAEGPPLELISGEGAGDFSATAMGKGKAHDKDSWQQRCVTYHAAMI
jgi:hypothetical protein